MNSKRWVAVGLVVLLLVVYARTDVNKSVSAPEGLSLLTSKAFRTETQRGQRR